MPSRSITLLVRAVGARAAARDLTMVSRATTAVGASSRRAGRDMTAMGATAGAVARGMNTLALGVGVVGAVAVKEGVKFNAMMEQQKIAFTSFLGSTMDADRYLGRLYDLAAVTPFEFPELVKGTRTMLAYGMASEDTYQTMKLLGDAIASAPTEDTANQIARTSRALGQVTAAGVLHAQDLNQLVDAGVTSVPKLAKEMGLSTKQFRKQMSLGKMDADRFFKAQRALWEKDPIYQGMAAKQAETFYGRLATLHDYTVQTLGSMTEGIFKPMSEQALPALIDLSRELGEVWRDDKLTLEQKMGITSTQVDKAMTPLLHSFEAWWQREDVTRRLETAFGDALKVALVGGVKGIWRVGGTLWSAFWSGGWEAKVGVGLVLARFGLTRAIMLGAGKLAWDRLMGGFGKGRAGRGGIAGKMLGSSTGVMHVNAGVVNVTQGVPGAPGGPGGGARGRAGRLGRLARYAPLAGPYAAGAAALGYGGYKGAEFLGEKFGTGRQPQRVLREDRAAARRGGVQLDAQGFQRRGAPRQSFVQRNTELYRGAGSLNIPPINVHSHTYVDGKKVATSVHRQAVKSRSTR